MEFKTCLVLIVSLSLAVTMINAQERRCAESGEYCTSNDNCCNGLCMSFRARCAPPSGGLIYPAGFQPPPQIPPMEQLPNQTNCAGLGLPCHSIGCCEPYYCGNFGNACKSP